MSISFTKMNGLGNDFVIIYKDENNFTPDKKTCLAIADRHKGIGYDQLILLSPSKNEVADIHMQIYNSDGSIAGACGNATRCVARLLFEKTKQTKAIIETKAGLLHVKKESDNIYSADMGEAHLSWDKIPLSKEVDTLNVSLGIDDIGKACCVNVGNPHAVFFVSNLDDINLEEIGSKLENHPIFPDRCNIEFAQIIDKTHIKMRVWERGAGITKACGSGACATLIAAVRRDLSDRNATIHLDGGDLNISWRKEDNHVILSGTASKNYDGEIYDEIFD